MTLLPSPVGRHNHSPVRNVVAIEVRIGAPDAPLKRFVGRFAWALSHLIAAGPSGVTPLENPAPRWSHYVHRLRRDGVLIATEDERHAGPYKGWHGRYRLISQVFVEREDAR